MFLAGRKCIFCDKTKIYKLKNKRVKCKYCKAYYSPNKLIKITNILYYFYLELSARKAAKELSGYHTELSATGTCSSGRA